MKLRCGRTSRRADSERKTRLRWSRGLFLCLALLGTGASNADSGWAAMRAPASGAPRVIGSYAAGCLQGAVALAPSGPGYQVVRMNRHRYFGYPDTVEFVKTLGARVEALGLAPLVVGDLSQARGGPMAFGHASHQNGLDVDIWYLSGPVPDTEVESPRVMSVVDHSQGRLIAGSLSARVSALLRMAADSPRVERIFVHPVIKRALCRSEPPAKRAWLRKLRPWWGHDEHFHVRLACPSDSPDCVRQAAQPHGNGCNENLDQWVVDATAARSAFPAPVKRTWRTLPASCQLIADKPSSLVVDASAADNSNQ